MDNSFQPYRIRSFLHFSHLHILGKEEALETGIGEGDGGEGTAEVK